MACTVARPDGPGFLPIGIGKMRIHKLPTYKTKAEVYYSGRNYDHKSTAVASRFFFLFCELLRQTEKGHLQDVIYHEQQINNKWFALYKKLK